MFSLIEQLEQNRGRRFGGQRFKVSESANAHEPLLRLTEGDPGLEFVFIWAFGSIH